MKKADSTLSVKMNKEELAVIERAAKEHGETKSMYARRVLKESAEHPFYTGKDVMQVLMQISYDMSQMTEENIAETIFRINERGARICQILSLK